METTEIVIVGVFGVWLLALSVFIFLQTRFFNRLTKNSKGGELNKVLKSILDTQRKNDKTLAFVEKEIKRLEKEGLDHVQNVGLIRFNPFKEIGGDHSFSLAILDGDDTGIIITGLHTRERTRIYAKTIKKGESDADLSDEERKALAKARK